MRTGACGRIVEHPGKREQGSGKQVAPARGPRSGRDGIEITGQHDIAGCGCHDRQEVVVLGVLESWFFKNRFNAYRLRAQIGEGPDHQRVEIPAHRPSKRLDRVLIDVHDDDICIGMPVAANPVLQRHHPVVHRVQRSMQKARQHTGGACHKADQNGTAAVHCFISHCSGFCLSFPTQSSKWRRGPFNVSPVNPMTSPSRTFCPSTALISVRCVYTVR